MRKERRTFSEWFKDIAGIEGLSTKQAGFISLIGGMWDAITDPIMGIISDHTRAKSGRHRRYLLIAVIPFMIAYIMKWT